MEVEMIQVELQCVSGHRVFVSPVLTPTPCVVCHGVMRWTGRFTIINDVVHRTSHKKGANMETPSNIEWPPMCRVQG